MAVIWKPGGFWYIRSKIPPSNISTNDWQIKFHFHWLTRYICFPSAPWPRYSREEKRHIHGRMLELLYADSFSFAFQRNALLFLICLPTLFVLPNRTPIWYTSLSSDTRLLFIYLYFFYCFHIYGLLQWSIKLVGCLSFVLYYCRAHCCRCVVIYPLHFLNCLGGICWFESFTALFFWNAVIEIFGKSQICPSI